MEKGLWTRPGRKTSPRPRMDLLRGALRAWRPHGPWIEETVADPILTELESHFDAVLARLAAEAGWVPARTAASKRILEHWGGR